MLTTNVPKQFWEDSILATYYLVNHMPTRVFNYQTPLKRFLQFYPQTQSFNQLPLKVFSCKAFVHVLDQNRTKLDPTALAYVFLGHSTTQRGIAVALLKTKNTLSLWMLHFFENQPFSPKIHFKGRM